MKAIAIGAFIVGLSATTAGADEDLFSANYLFSGCQEFIARNGAVNARSGICFGIIRAIIFTGTNLKVAQMDYASPNDAIAWLHCLNVPDGVSGTQAVRVVVSYISARPARMHERFEDLAIEAPRDAWPCK